jgi:hypothetical protein
MIDFPQVLVLVALFVTCCYIALRGVRTFEPPRSALARLRALRERLAQIEEEHSAMADQLQELTSQQEFTEKLVRGRARAGDDDRSALL